jgi:hypothetical protein
MARVNAIAISAVVVILPTAAVELIKRASDATQADVPPPIP